MTIWDTSRKLRLPGMVVNAYIEVDSISPRIRNAARKMLATGVLRGGYSSRACQLAMAIREEVDPNIPMVWLRRNAYGTLYVRHESYLHQEFLTRLVELTSIARIGNDGRFCESAYEIHPNYGLSLFYFTHVADEVVAEFERIHVAGNRDRYLALVSQLDAGNVIPVSVPLN